MNEMKSAIYTVFCILLWCSLIGLIIFYNFSNWFPDRSCYSIIVTLHNQRVEKLEGCCDNCLIFNVTELYCRGNCGDGCGCQYRNVDYYFKNENQIRNDLKNNSDILVKWCWVNSIKEYRIRSVSNRE
jgi:hypothetical protein